MHGFLIFISNKVTCDISLRVPTTLKNLSLNRIFFSIYYAPVSNSSIPRIIISLVIKNISSLFGCDRVSKLMFTSDKLLIVYFYED